MIHQDIYPEHGDQDASFDPSYEKEVKKKEKLKKHIVKQRYKKEREREDSPYTRTQKRIQKIKEAKEADDYRGGNLEDLDVSGTSS